MYKSITTIAALLGAAAVTATPTGFKTLLPCDEQITALATGIHLNIQGQYAERNGTAAILAIEAADPINITAFYIAKGELLSDIQTGMNLRLFNQQVAPAGNPVIPGLAEYEAAEEVEKSLALELNGDPDHDTPLLHDLLSDIQTGIELNQDNFANATSGCTIYVTYPPVDEEGS